MSEKQADSNTSEAKFKEVHERLDRIEGKIKGISGQVGVIRNKVGVPKPGTASDKPEPGKSESLEGEKQPKEASDTHFVKPYDKICTTCGEPNTEFKDETKCDGCGKHLGAIATIKQVKSCPDCGSHSATPLRELTSEEAKLFGK